jgi:hypothetical protein
MKQSICCTWIAIGTLGFVSGGRAQLIGNYSFADVAANAGGTIDPTPPPIALGVDFGAFHAVGVGTTPRSGGAWSFSGWSTDGAIDSGRYFETTLSPLGPARLDLGSLSFDVRRSASGPRDFVVRSSLDSFASNLPGTVSPANAELGVVSGAYHFANDTGFSENLAGPRLDLGSGFDALTQPVSFRIYAFGSEQSGGTFTVDNVAFNGAITAVPEPEEYAAVFGSGLALYGFWRRRRNLSATDEVPERRLGRTL